MVPCASRSPSPEQTDRERNVERLLRRLPRRRRGGLRQREFKRGAGFVIAHLRSHARRTGLRVPALELGQIATVGVRNRGDEILTGHRLAVVALAPWVAVVGYETVGYRHGERAAAHL